MPISALSNNRPISKFEWDELSRKMKKQFHICCSYWNLVGVPGLLFPESQQQAQVLSALTWFHLFPTWWPYVLFLVFLKIKKTTLRTPKTKTFFRETLQLADVADDSF